MTQKLESSVNKLITNESLSYEDFLTLLAERTDELSDELAKAALNKKREIYGDDIFVRGLVEVSNYCKNNCYYCGIQAANRNLHRYRLTKDEIISCTKDGYELGFRTFVLQSGEDDYFTDDILCDIISTIKGNHPDCAVTLGFGERGYDSFKRLFDAGADRYLLRHETADEEHYKRLHPQNMSYKNRMDSLYMLREIGYQVGCGFMVGSPYQTNETIAKDLYFIQDFKPDMCGIGPFVPSSETIFAKEKAGSAELTCYLLSIIRLIHPHVLLPATTALGTIDALGREKGLKAGANVLMPNLSPVSVRSDYALYDNKICTGDESAQCMNCLSARVKSVGAKIVIDRGDIK